MHQNPVEWSRALDIARAPQSFCHFKWLSKLMSQKDFKSGMMYWSNGSILTLSYMTFEIATKTLGVPQDPILLKICHKSYDHMQKMRPISQKFKDI